MTYMYVWHAALQGVGGEVRVQPRLVVHMKGHLCGREGGRGRERESGGGRGEGGREEVIIVYCNVHVIDYM